MTKNKDWTGDGNSLRKLLGASNLNGNHRQHDDYYATDPIAAEWLLKIVPLDKDVPIWECSSGEDHLANVFRKHGYTVRTSDIVKRTPTTEVLDFLSKENDGQWNGNIITNPPYSKATEFLEKALSLVPDGMKVIMFLKIQFLEGKRRRKLYQETPPKEVWVSSSRLMCAKNGDFETMIASGGSIAAYAWYVFEKGYRGDTVLKWFN